MKIDGGHIPDYYLSRFDDPDHFSCGLASFNSARLFMNFTPSNIKHMELQIDNTQLDCELQEMYMISSHWKTDIDFVKDEIRFLKNTLSKYKTGIDSTELVKVFHFQKIIEQEEAKIPEVESRINSFLLLMAPIVNHSKNEFGLDVLETFNDLETGISSIVNYFSLVKRLVFSFLEKIITSKKTYQAALNNKKPLPLKYQL